MDEQITYGSKIAYNVYSRREVIAKRPLDLIHNFGFFSI